MQSFMDVLIFTSCKSDCDVWMGKATTNEGVKYWEFVLLYVDDWLCISHYGDDVLNNEMWKHSIIKQSSIWPPNIYLGVKVRKKKIDTTKGPVNAWAFSSYRYAREVVSKV